jgi:G6PDH family F420-dependent oxidoreductase
VIGYLDGMTRFGYTLMCEQSGPSDLVRAAVRAEQAGFDFEVISDHYSPWLISQGHSPNAWVTLGAVAHATERVDLMTYVTCPIMRYHPAVVAQQAATVGMLSGGRFLLGLGAGENLNEHVVGRGWPPANVRHEMFDEAVRIIRSLFSGDYVNFAGRHFRVDSAKLWDVGEPPPRIGLAISGEQSAQLAGELADAMIAVEPESRLGELFDNAGGSGKPRIGQVPICWDPSRDAAIDRAHDQFRWFGGGWKVNAELPGPSAFAAASQFVRKEDVADSIPCGPDVDAHVAAVQEFVKAGFTDVAVVQVGGERQPEFLDWAEKELLPALRGL